MMPLRKSSFWLLTLFSFVLVGGPPTFSEPDLSERTQSADIIIEEIFQPGSGLPVGKIHAVRGDVVVFHRDPRVGYRAQSGLPIYSGDTIHTRGISWISCRLIDGSKLALTADTTLTILQSNYNLARQSSVSFLKLNRGGARFKFRPSADLAFREFKIQTETAFIVAQNADFIIKLNPTQTEITALEGTRLEVTGMAQPEEFITLTDFQQTTIQEDMVSQTVETLAAEHIEAMMAKFDLLPHYNLFTAKTDYRREDEIIDENLEEDGVAGEEPNFAE